MKDSVDFILQNANIITCEPAQPSAQALAIKGERIHWLGTNQEASRFKNPNMQVIDCQGSTLVPGFIDAHCHIFSYIRKLFSLDLSPQAVRSIGEIKEVIRRKARFTPAGCWITGTDYNEFYLAEKRHLTRWDLDEVAPNHPVIISHRSQHASVLNSLALQLVDITNKTEEPPGGMIERDLETGEPNGILFEMEEFLRSRINFPLSQNELKWGITEANRKYLSMGITSLGEATVSNNFAQWENFKKLSVSSNQHPSSKGLKSRIYMMIGVESMREFHKAGLTTGSGDINLKLGSVKIVLTETRGELQPSQKELNEMVLEASRSGFQVAIHAVERSTVEAAIKALEYVKSHPHPNPLFSRARRPGAEARPRIEHCSECPPELIRKLKKLGAVVVSQPPFLYYHGERYLSQVPAETQPWLYPFRSFLDSGLTVAGSSDSPVVPNSPLIGIFAAVNRQAESGQYLFPHERVSIQQALEMYTINAAYASFEEEEKGSFAPGKLADIVMLSSVPLESTPDQIKDIIVEMTMIGGKVVYKKNS